MVRHRIKNSKKMGVSIVIAGGIVGVVVILVMMLFSDGAFAEGDSAVDTVEITVPTACTMAGTVDTAHTVSMMANTYSGANGIGKTTLNT